MEHPITKFKVAKKYIKDFPFDLFYVVHQSQKKLIPRMFPYALAMGFSAELIKCSKAVKQVYNTQGVSDLANLRSWLEDRRHEYLCVVPVMMRWKRPDYLLAPRHRNTSTNLGGGVIAHTHTLVSHLTTNILNDQTVLFTPGGPVRPICLKCPRHLVHVVKDNCELGSQTCMEQLDLLIRKGSNEQLPQHSIPRNCSTEHSS